MPKFIVFFFERKTSRYPPQQHSGTILIGNPVKAHDYNVFLDPAHEEKVSRRIQLHGDYHYCIMLIKLRNSG
jgi:4-aminobutyrate aminotransferase-like enzyme